MSEGARSDDQELLTRFLAGEAQACRQVEKWARDTVRHGPFTIPPDDHADLVQLTLEKIWGLVQADGFALKVSLRALVRRVATARAIDWLRTRKQTTEVDESSPDDRASPYDDVRKSDEIARLQAGLRSLDESCQEILRLHFFEELPYNEIAARLDRAPATLRVRVFNCVRKLREYMSKFE